MTPQYSALDQHLFQKITMIKVSLYGWRIRMKPYYIWRYFQFFKVKILAKGKIYIATLACRKKISIMTLWMECWTKITSRFSAKQSNNEVLHLVNFWSFGDYRKQLIAHHPLYCEINGTTKEVEQNGTIILLKKKQGFLPRVNKDFNKGEHSVGKGKTILERIWEECKMELANPCPWQPYKTLRGAFLALVPSLRILKF